MPSERFWEEQLDELRSGPRGHRRWTCYHCDETFTTPLAARKHFGATPEATPGCWGESDLLKALRRVEEERDEARRLVAKLVERNLGSPNRDTTTETVNAEGPSQAGDDAPPPSSVKDTGEADGN